MSNLRPSRATDYLLASERAAEKQPRGPGIWRFSTADFLAGLCRHGLGRFRSHPFAREKQQACSHDARTHTRMHINNTLLACVSITWKNTTQLTASEGVLIV